jgi:hypothetical protein
MHSLNYPGRESSLPEKDKEESGEENKNDQQRSDPPLTEIKGVADPEEYVEPEVEEEPEK